MVMMVVMIINTHLDAETSLSRDSFTSATPIVVKYNGVDDSSSCSGDFLTGSFIQGFIP